MNYNSELILTAYHFAIKKNSWFVHRFCCRKHNLLSFVYFHQNHDLVNGDTVMNKRKNIFAGFWNVVILHSISKTCRLSRHNWCYLSTSIFIATNVTGTNLESNIHSIECEISTYSTKVWTQNSAGGGGWGVVQFGQHGMINTKLIV